MPTDQTLTSTESDVVDGVPVEGQFRAEEGGQVHCFTCGKDFPAGDVDASSARRLEGVSDPADMMLVVPVSCPHCATSGSLTLNYGPEATFEDSEVVRDLGRDRPDEPSTS